MNFVRTFAICFLMLSMVAAGSKNLEVENLNIPRLGNDTDPGNTTTSPTSISSAPSNAPSTSHAPTTSHTPSTSSITLAPTSSNSTDDTSPPSVSPTTSKTTHQPTTSPSPTISHSPTKIPTIQEPTSSPTEQPSASGNKPAKAPKSLLKKCLVAFGWMCFTALLALLFGACLLYRRQIYYIAMEIWYELRRIEFKRRFMACVRRIPGTGRCFGGANGQNLNSVIGDQGDMTESLLEG